MVLAMNNVKLPVGISDFHKLRQNEYYYVDKTNLIKELLESRIAEVTLITRPRRFGKTIGMSMLAYFFDIRKDSRKLFEDLKISRDIELCQKWMNQYPTLFISFKDVDGLNFQSAMKMLRNQISWICNEHDYLSDSDKVNENDKKIFLKLQDISEENLSEDLIKISVATIIRMMNAHYGKPVILLLDEYDVPLVKASSNGYYKEMLDVMKTMMSTSLKDNSHLQFAVVTGCLKIAKESIFTGTNNFISDTIISTHLNEYFGFTDQEVKDILKDIGLQEHFKEIKEWYDGYNFGEFEVYCPWDVMNYLRDLQNDLNARPVSYWKNTSDNAIIRSFIDYTGAAIRKKLEVLIAGGSICQKIEEDLTYDYLHSSEDNLWSILYLTGYLTKVGERDKDGQIELRIPNKEVKEIFESTVRKWFEDSARVTNRKDLFDAVWNKDADKATKEISTLLRMTISYYDYRENFYHAFLAGIFAGAGYSVESNREHGEGRSDIVIYNDVTGQVAVFEAKYSRKLEDLEKDCQKALDQINTKMYAKEFADAYEEVLCYGIAFYKKRCLVKSK